MVSTEEQAANGYSLGNQRARIGDIVRAKDWPLTHVYGDGDRVCSAKDLERPGIRKLIEDAKAKRFDVIIVHKLHRLTQRQYERWWLLDKVFEPKGIDFVSVTEGLDTSLQPRCENSDALPWDGCWGWR